MQAPLEQARASFLQGVAHFEAGLHLQARACFEASLALAPGRPSVLANLGICLFTLGEWQPGVDVLEQATAADASNADAWISLGLCHEHLARWQAAADCLTRGLALRPGTAMLWLILGQCRMRLGAIKSALEAFDTSLALSPDFADAWSARGSLMREIGHFQDATLSFEKALAHGADPVLNSYYLAAVRGETNPPAPPRLYVESLFDDYAADFQTHLVQQLGYQAHETLLRPLLNEGRRFYAVLDIGCGTGLCGTLIQPLSQALDGVDVSSAMLAQARATGVYRDLAHADLTTYLCNSTQRYDLVLAADVFIYVGALEVVFREVRRLLMPGGCFAFSLEPSETQDVQLLPSLRYAHSQDYIRRLAQEHGFDIKQMALAPIRHDQQEPVMGLYAYLSHPG